MTTATSHFPFHHSPVLGFSVVQDWLRRAASRKTAHLLLQSPLSARLSDDSQRALATQVADQTRDIAFTFSVIALSVPLVRQEGRIVSARYLAFRQAFPMQASEDAKLRSLFDLAAKEELQARHYVRRIVMLFPTKQPLYLDVVRRLLQIASISGALSVSDYNYICHTARQFGISQREWKQMISVFGAPKASTPYGVLGVRKSWTTAAIKAAHTRLMKQYHPDRFQAEGASPETISLLNQRVAEINAAYSAILKQRKRA